MRVSSESIPADSTAPPGCSRTVRPTMSTRNLYSSSHASLQETTLADTDRAPLQEEEEVVVLKGFARMGVMLFLEGLLPHCVDSRQKFALQAGGEIPLTDQMAARYSLMNLMVFGWVDSLPERRLEHRLGFYVYL